MNRSWTAFAATVLLMQPLPARAAMDGMPSFGTNADYEVGASLVKQQDWPRAIASLTSAARSEPANADVQNLLGYAYRKQGKLDLAFRHYHEALRLDPKHRGAHEYIGEAYLLAGNKAKAEQHLAELEKLCGKGCEEYQDLARAIAAAQ